MTTDKNILDIIDSAPAPTDEHGVTNVSVVSELRDEFFGAEDTSAERQAQAEREQEGGDGDPARPERGHARPSTSSPGEHISQTQDQDREQAEPTQSPERVAQVYDEHQQLLDLATSDCYSFGEAMRDARVAAQYAAMVRWKEQLGLSPTASVEQVKARVDAIGRQRAEAELAQLRAGKGGATQRPGKKAGAAARERQAQPTSGDEFRDLQRRRVEMHQSGAYDARLDDEYQQATAAREEQRWPGT